VLAVLYGLDLIFQARIINPYYTRILMLSGISITLAVSLNLINGFTGQFSIGHAGFMAVAPTLQPTFRSTTVCLSPTRLAGECSDGRLDSLWRL
jgi:hypothetical protein